MKNKIMLYLLNKLFIFLFILFINKKNFFELLNKFLNVEILFLILLKK